MFLDVLKCSRYGRKCRNRDRNKVFDIGAERTWKFRWNLIGFIVSDSVVELSDVKNQGKLRSMMANGVRPPQSEKMTGKLKHFIDE